MSDSQYYKDEIKWLRQELEVFRTIFDSILKGAMVTDPDGIILHFNDALGALLGVTAEDQIGRHCQDVIKDSRMQLVAETATAEINVPHEINGQEMRVQRIPMIRDGKVIGVFGQVISDIPNWKEPEVDSSGETGRQPSGIKDVQKEAEKAAILAALKANRFNKTRAAQQLGIHRTLLYKKMKKYNMSLHPSG